jgi:single-strand DNA-binding protein
MASFNKVILVGNVTRDLELRYTVIGTAICDLGLAVNHQYTDQRTNEKKQEVTFVDVTLFGRQAEIAFQYLAKGKPVLIEGRLKYETWTDQTTQQKRTKLKVVGESLQLLGQRDGGQQAAGRAAGAPLSAEEAIAAAEDETPF